MSVPKLKFRLIFLCFWILVFIVSGILINYAKSNDSENFHSFMDIEKIIYQNSQYRFCEVKIAKYSRLLSEDVFDAGASLSDLGDETSGAELKILHIGLDAKTCISDAELRKKYVRDTNNKKILLHFALKNNTIIMVNTEEKIAYLIKEGW